MEFNIKYLIDNNIKGAIFDMDGTLTDSMTSWNLIYKELFDYLKIDFYPEFLMKVNHLPMEKRVDIIIDEFKLEYDHDSLFSIWKEMVNKYYSNKFKIKPYMLEIVKQLKENNIKMAIATASDVSCGYNFIKSNNIEQYFDNIIGLMEVDRPKSFPDIYLLSAQKLGLNPNDCIVFEDALTPLLAASSGGFKICAVQDDCSNNDKEKIIACSNLNIGF